MSWHIKRLDLSKDDEANLWDAFVLEQPDASPYHLSGWLRATQGCYRQRIEPLIAVDDQAQNHSLNAQPQMIRACLPVVVFKGLTGRCQATSLPYCDVGHALIETTPSIEQQHTLLATTGIDRDEFIRAVCDFLAIDELHYRDGTLSEVITEQSAPALKQGKVRMRMPLVTPSAELLASFKSKLRSQIRKAEKNGLSVQQVTGNCAGASTLVEDFYRVFCINMRKLGSPVHDKRWFQQIVHYYDTKAVVAVVYKGSTPIGGGIVLHTHTTASIPWASTDPDYNHLAPNMLLYWAMLAYCSDIGLQEFDFGRSTYGEGTFKFKKQWGATPTPLTWSLHSKTAEVPIPATQPSALRQLLATYWQYLPLSLSVSLGKRIRGKIDL